MKRDMFFWPADLPKVKYCSENNKRLIHLSTCEVYWKTIGSYLPKYSPLRQCKIMGNLFCLYQVDQSTVAIKEAFGKFDDVLEPGCHCVPWGFGKQIAGLLTLRLQQLDVKCETKTKVLLLRTCFIGKQQSWGLLIVHTLVGCSLFQSIFLLTIHSNPQRLHLGRRYSIQTSTAMELPLKWKLVESLKKELPEGRTVDLETNPLHGPLKPDFSSKSVESTGI